ncbi:MAG TPA: hypothetical protein VK446_16445 [Methylocystis sp.]|nr:hypothetical protein [Methylocystis sp.]
MIEARDVRLLALWRDDPLVAPMTVDLRLDAKGAVVSAWDLFGAFDLDGAECRPFVLRRDGGIDFGAGDERRWRTNLRDAAVAVDARFTVRWNDADSGVYRIVKIAALGAKDARR